MSDLVNREGKSGEDSISPAIIHDVCNAGGTAASNASATNRTTRQVLFLCTGNYYRSRFAEMLFNHLAELKRLPWRATSRGLRLTNKNVGPIAACTVDALAERGVSLPAKQSFPQSAEDADFAVADLVVAIKRDEHEPMIAARFAHWSAKVRYWGVHDVDFAPPETAIAELDAAVRLLLDELS